MKMKNLKIAAALLACTALFAGCDLLENVASTPTVSLTALSDSFDAQGEASVSVVLSSYALEEVTVSLAVSGDLAAAVTLEKVVKIGVASKSKPVAVKIDLDQVKADSNVTIAIQSAVGATVGTPKEVSIAVKAPEAKPVEEPGVVSLTADEQFAADGTAKINVKLDKALEADVAVELEVKSADDYATIPAAALQFASPVTIAAGQTAAEVTVTVDPAELPVGDNYALIAVKAVTGNAAPAKNAEVQILYTKELVPTLREDWIIEYCGNYEYVVDESTSYTYDLIGFTGLGEQAFIFDYYTAGTLAYNNMTPADYVLAMNNSINSKIAAGATPQDLYVVTPTEDPYGLFFNLFTPGEYEAILLACNADGSLTGEYAFANFEVVDPEEATPEYEAWIGQWTINGDTFYFDRAWNNKSLDVWGFDPYYSLPAVADYNKENNTLEFRFQFMDEDSTYEYYLGGIDSTNSFYTFGDEEQDDLLAVLSATTDGYSFDPVTYAVNPDDYGVSELTVGSLGVLGWHLTDKRLYWFSNFTYYTIPTTEVVKVDGLASGVRSAKKNLSPLAKGFTSPKTMAFTHNAHKAVMAK